MVIFSLFTLVVFWLHSGMPGAIQLCATAFQQKWATNRQNAFPVDDRQVYNPVNAFLNQKVMYQVRERDQ